MISNWTVQLGKICRFWFTSIISLRLPNLFLIELMFRYEKINCCSLGFSEILVQARNSVDVHEKVGKFQWKNRPWSTYALRGREEIRAYIYCFYDVVLFFKSVQSGRMYLKIAKFEHSYFMNGPEGVRRSQGICKFLHYLSRKMNDNFFINVFNIFIQTLIMSFN